MYKTVRHIAFVLLLSLSVVGMFVFESYSMSISFSQLNISTANSGKLFPQQYLYFTDNQDNTVNVFDLEDNDEPVNDYSKNNHQLFYLRIHASSELASNKLHTFQLFYTHQLSLKQHEGYYLFSLSKILI